MLQKCKICLKRYSNKYSKSVHKCKGPVTKVCHRCKKEFSSVTNRNKHLRKKICKVESCTPSKCSSSETKLHASTSEFVSTKSMCRQGESRSKKWEWTKYFQVTPTDESNNDISTDDETDDDNTDHEGISIIGSTGEPTSSCNVLRDDPLTQSDKPNNTKGRNRNKEIEIVPNHVQTGVKRPRYNTDHEDDCDEQFLRSCVKLFKTLSPKQNTEARMEILEILYKKKFTSDVPSAQTFIDDNLSNVSSVQSSRVSSNASSVETFSQLLSDVPPDHTFYRVSSDVPPDNTCGQVPADTPSGHTYNEVWSDAPLGHTNIQISSDVQTGHAYNQVSSNAPSGHAYNQVSSDASSGHASNQFSSNPRSCLTYHQMTSEAPLSRTFIQVSSDAPSDKAYNQFSSDAPSGHTYNQVSSDVPSDHTTNQVSDIPASNAYKQNVNQASPDDSTTSTYNQIPTSAAAIYSGSHFNIKEPITCTSNTKVCNPRRIPMREMQLS